MKLGAKYTLPLLLALAGCVYLRDNLVEVSAAEGSNDHRIFRLGSVTQLMMEPVLWKLQDLELINFNLPVTLYFKDELPTEYSKITLKMLHDGKSGLPDGMLDFWHLPDNFIWFNDIMLGDAVYEHRYTRQEFVERLKHPRVLESVRKRSGRHHSDIAYALMMMAICDELKTSPQQLCEQYLIRLYGLRDTCFEMKDGFRARLTPSCAGALPFCYFKGMEVGEGRNEVFDFYAGMYSSASDVLKIAYVMFPHLDRSYALLTSQRVDSRHWAYYSASSVPGGIAFVGFDTKNNRAAVLLKNQYGWLGDEGLEFMQTMYAPLRL